MTYWEPVRTPDRYLEPPDPEPEWCEACERDMDYCDCGECEACGETGPTKETPSGDETLWLCPNCAKAEGEGAV